MRTRGPKLGRLFNEEIGQDLSEYCLLLALVILIAVGIFLKVSGGVQTLWTSTNSTLTNAATAPAASAGSAPHQ